MFQADDFKRIFKKSSPANIEVKMRSFKEKLNSFFLTNLLCSKQHVKLLNNRKKKKKR